MKIFKNEEIVILSDNRMNYGFCHKPGVIFCSRFEQIADYDEKLFSMVSEIPSELMYYLLNVLFTNKIRPNSEFKTLVKIVRD